MQHNFYLPKNREEFKNILKEVIDENGFVLENDSSQQEGKIYTRKEAAEYLKISLPTLNQRTKEGLIKASRIGNRVLYLQSELNKALK
ncbi:helix-turn-helix domain-containing protein [Ferruginibacter albus]|uniref:helix-turn-helix domain-containing protein n=1 Tax=Ferruginibacter albus TaxID=2875540 RepID=UPI001CC51328|nr:helix-turn-helix domain-containing protein [Ferruginibacter albus]UAY52140.1 helix-turn-helix domain-containing protein [Ferruginibacter albus]